jgi:two-component system CheB/CheR fusion protein
VATRRGTTRGPPASGRNRKQAPQQASEGAPAQLAPRPVSTDPGPLVVGIGGSAGSLSPLRELLAGLPADCGIAFVVVSHQAPTGHSMLAEILAKCTAMPVREISETTRVEANHVYVEPRGYHVEIHGGMLRIEPVGLRGVPHLPIDLFFRALARERGSLAAGIVLSGTGTDGTLGLAAIRAASGLSLVQDPATAEFDGMPVSAIEARAADFVVSPADMPARLLEHAKRIASRAHADTEPGIAAKELDRVLAVMRHRGGRDFSEYKHGTLVRRIERRMHLHGIDDMEAYARLLEQSGDEIDALWRDWLIGVSSFFRDPEAFRALESALPDLLARREDGSPLRIWIPGCATGEEAYSLIIVLLETLRRLKKDREVQVFATDLNPAAIQVARAGRYPGGIAADVSEQRLTRFFSREDEFLRVKKDLRDLVVFAVQDALHDPPFTRVDLVSCRNLLIYLEPNAQRRLLSSFHYSLNPGGILLLGSAENVVGSEEFFLPLDGHFKIFRRNDATPPQPTLRWPGTRGVNRDAAASVRRVGAKTDLAGPLSSALADRFGPPAVLVDERGLVQQIHGQVGAYLELPAGRVNVNVVDMARQGLRAPLASALREASAANGVVERSASVDVGGERLALHLKVGRLDEPRLADRLFLISFEPVERSPRRRARTSQPIEKRRRAGRRPTLEQELQNARSDLQGHIDELQAANEELASANEEAQAANEELQSTNEELQTAKEETQSLNEELHTVNAELTDKLETFERATDDLLNLMNNIEVATIFLDEELRVMRFTPQARNVARLIDTDIGRPLADLATLVDYPDLLSDAANVNETLHASEKQVVAPGGDWYLVRIRPYRTARNTVGGVVITFVEITDAKQTERIQAARVLAESIVDAVRDPFLVLDREMRVVRANRAYYQAFRAEPAQTEGRRIGELGSHHWSIPTLRERLEKALQEGTGFDDFEVEGEFPYLGRRRLVLNARLVSPTPGSPADLVLLGIQDPSQPQAGGARPEQRRR